MIAKAGFKDTKGKKISATESLPKKSIKIEVRGSLNAKPKQKDIGTKNTSNLKETLNSKTKIVTEKEQKSK